jgi:3D-(3,5/4)-trihydroxycyclohexane-1,2-dione acylhydrolase (decyclizing)
MATATDLDRATRSPARTERLTTAQALVRYLAAQSTERDGVRRPLIPAMFGIFGHGNAAGLGQALADRQGGMRYLQGKNEQAMVHAAIGFAKAQARLSTLAVTTSIGPGATNLVSGAATATVNRVPVLLLPGDVFARRRQGPVLQQLEHGQSFDTTVNDCLRPVSRYFDRITRPEQLVESLPHAVMALLDPGDTGAVTIALCQDVQAEAYDYPTGLFEPRVHTVFRQPPAPAAVEEAAGRLVASQRPFVISGGGVRYAGAEAALAGFSDTFGVPVGETLAGRGTAGAGELAAGGLGFIGSRAANALAAEADLVLAVGTRLTDAVTGSHSLFQDPAVSFVAVNVSRFDAVKLNALPVLGDARVTLDALAQALAGRGWHAQPEWRARARSVVGAWRAEVEAELAKPRERLLGYEVIDELARFTTPEDRVVLSSSTAIGYAHSFWGRSRSARLELEYGFSCMGHEIPAAIGMRLARPSAGDVYAVLGDGTYLMGNTGELVTAVQEGLRCTAIVLVNNGYQCIRGFEENALGREFGTQFRKRGPDGNYDGAVVTVDYAANAASLGCRAFTVSTRQQLRDALAASRQGDVPCVIAAHVADVDFAVPAGAWWDYGSPEAGADPELARRHAEYLEQAAHQRWYV